jgi:2Fe-2S ferredoxin
MPDELMFWAGGIKIPAEPGQSVLAAMQAANAKIQTVCKGRGICGACRVLVDEGWFHRLPPPAKNEARLLSYLKQGAEHHRLACQIILDEHLSGLRVKPDPLPIQTLAKETTK